MSNKTKVGIAIVLLVAIAGIAIHSASKARADIRVGAVLPLSGFGAYWGEPVQHGVQLAVEDIQKQYGKNSFDVVVEDGQSAAKASASAAQKLISTDGVNALYSEFSGPGSAISPIAQSANVPLMYSAFNQTIVKTNPLSIKVFMNFEEACDIYARHAQAAGIKKIGIVSQFVEVAPYCVSALEKVYPADSIVLTDNVTGTDFRTIILKMKQQGVDSVISMLYEDGSLNLLKQMGEQNYHPAVFGEYADAATDKVVTGAPSNAEGMIYFATRVNPDFIASYQARFPNEKTDKISMEGIANGYDGMWNLFLVEKECNKDAACVAGKFADATMPEHAIAGTTFKDRVKETAFDFFEIRGGHRVPATLQ